MKRYRDALDIWVLPMWATRRLRTIQKVELDHWLTALAAGIAPHAANRRVKATGLSPSSIKAVWVPFKASLATAVELGWLVSNPAQRVETTKSRRPESIFLSYLEVDRLVSAAMALNGQLSDAMMVELMAFAGLRPGEVVALQGTGCRREIATHQSSANDDNRHHGRRYYRRAETRRETRCADRAAPDWPPAAAHGG